MTSSPSKIDRPKDIGQLAREARRASNLTQARAAALCGVGIRFLSEMENGKASLHLGKVLKVLHGLGLVLMMKRKTFTDG